MKITSGLINNITIGLLALIPMTATCIIAVMGSDVQATLQWIDAATVGAFFGRVSNGSFNPVKGTPRP